MIEGLAILAIVLFTMSANGHFVGLEHMTERLVRHVRFRPPPGVNPKPELKALDVTKYGKRKRDTRWQAKRDADAIARGDEPSDDEETIQRKRKEEKAHKAYLREKDRRRRGLAPEVQKDEDDDGRRIVSFKKEGWGSMLPTTCG